MRIAIDTNVLIAAVTRPGGTGARIVQTWLDGRLEVVASTATIREVELVLGAGWLARMVSPEVIEVLLEALRTRSVFIEQPPRILDLRLKDAGDTILASQPRSEEHTSELQSRGHLVCRLLLEKK